MPLQRTVAGYGLLLQAVYLGIGIYLMVVVSRIAACLGRIATALEQIRLERSRPE